MATPVPPKPPTAVASPPYVSVYVVKGRSREYSTVLIGLENVPGWDQDKDTRRLVAALDRALKCKCSVTVVGTQRSIHINGDHKNDALLELLAKNGLRREWTELAWFM